LIEEKQNFRDAALDIVSFASFRPGLKNDIVARINVHGVISSYRNQAAQPSMIPSLGAKQKSVTYDLIKGCILKAKKYNAKAYIIDIDSPGGAVNASYEIADLIKEIEEPTFAHVCDMAASGGYMIASACDKIVAQKYSRVGSIGAFMPLFDVKELAEMLGIRYYGELRSAKNKGIGHPLEGLTDEQVKFFQKDLIKFHEEFVDYVAEARDVPRDKIATLADGLVYNAHESVGTLVDEIGTFETIKKELEEKGFEKVLIKTVLPKGNFSSQIVSMMESMGSSLGEGLAGSLTEKIKAELIANQNQFRM